MPAPPDFRDLLQGLAQAWLQTRDLAVALRQETLARLPSAALTLPAVPPHAEGLTLDWADLMPPAPLQTRTLSLDFQACLLHTDGRWRWQIVQPGWRWPWRRAPTHQVAVSVCRGDPDQMQVHVDGQLWLRCPVSAASAGLGDAA